MFKFLDLFIRKSLKSKKFEDSKIFNCSLFTVSSGICQFEKPGTNLRIILYHDNLLGYSLPRSEAFAHDLREPNIDLNVSESRTGFQERTRCQFCEGRHPFRRA